MDDGTSILGDLGLRSGAVLIDADRKEPMITGDVALSVTRSVAKQPEAFLMSHFFAISRQVVAHPCKEFEA